MTVFNTGMSGWLNIPAFLGFIPFRPNESGTIHGVWMRIKIKFKLKKAEWIL